ncbi:MAG: sulfurtransferase [Neptuniibacter sp.]
MHQTIVSADTLNQHLNRDDWVIFDCRFNLMDTAAGFAAYQQGHIPGAHYLHLDNDLSSAITPDSGRHPLPDPEKLAHILVQAGVSSQTQVVVYDDCGGAMAARAWWLLRWLGHDAVAVLDGGYPVWLQNYVSSTDLPKTAVADFEPVHHDRMNLSAEQLLRELNGSETLLVDARAEERFLGKAEPIDPIAGHVPGAVNRPLTDNLDNGQFKSAGQLKTEWLELLRGVEPQSVVHMCGSGVTACHNQLAMEFAGLGGSRLYAGSWSEWIRDTSRPVAKG